MTTEYHTFKYKLSEDGVRPKEGCVLSDTLDNHDVITSYFEEIELTIAVDDFGIAKISHVNGNEVKED